MAFMKGTDVIVMLLLGLFTFNASTFQTFCGFGGVLLIHIQWQLFVMYNITTTVDIPDPAAGVNATRPVEASIFHLTVLGPQDVHSVVFVSYICNFFTQLLLGIWFYYQDYQYCLRQSAKWEELLPDTEHAKNSNENKNYYRNFSAFNMRLTVFMTVPLMVGCFIGLLTINYITEMALTYILFSSCIFFVLTFISLWMMQALERKRIEDVIKEDLLSLENLRRVQVFDDVLNRLGVQRGGASQRAGGDTIHVNPVAVKKYHKRRKIAEFLRSKELLTDAGSTADPLSSQGSRSVTPAASPTAASPSSTKYKYLEQERQQYLDKYDLTLYLNDGNTANSDNVNKGPFLTMCVVASFFAGLSASYIGTSAPPVLIFAVWSRIPPFLFKINYGVASIIPCLMRLCFVLAGGVFESRGEEDSLVNTIYNHATKNTESEVVELLLFGIVAVLCSVLGITLAMYLLYYHNRVKAKRLAEQGGDAALSAVRSVRNYYFKQNNKKSFYFSVVVTLLSLALVLFVKSPIVVTVLLVVGYTLVGYSFYEQNTKHKRHWDEGKEGKHGHKRKQSAEPFAQQRSSRHKYPPCPPNSPCSPGERDKGWMLAMAGLERDDNTLQEEEEGAAQHHGKASSAGESIAVDENDYEMEERRAAVEEDAPLPQP
ncbi:hypothetical protein ADEAN_000515700 [Angomonas deanei]|uniref:Transmembrane protein n=1 Tax=Angomonas deanei TaxID=59799 RepID=A0A7G2CF80_9TRYP|nr:hypothetical protein ADEAN_000515700 [Angomonas deanei]